MSDEIAVDTTKVETVQHVPKLPVSAGVLEPFNNRAHLAMAASRFGTTGC